MGKDSLHRENCMCKAEAGVVWLEGSEPGKRRRRSKVREVGEWRLEEDRLQTAS